MEIATCGILDAKRKAAAAKILFDKVVLIGTGDWETSASDGKKSFWLADGIRIKSLGRKYVRFDSDSYPEAAYPVSELGGRIVILAE